MKNNSRKSKRPCVECPWRCDTPPGKFTAERYDALRTTTGELDGPTLPLGTPMFACHMSAPDKEIVCMGWLAAVGVATNLTARVNVATGAIALEPDETWPALFRTYDEMADAQGRKK